MSDERKRKATDNHGDADRRAKSKKQWRVPHKYGANEPSRNIQPGDSGIWATCEKGKEGKCIGELRDLFSEYADLLYQDSASTTAEQGTQTKQTESDELDIESEIRQELDGIRKPASKQLFVPIKIDIQCVVFFRTSPPVEPVSFVERILEDAAKDPQRKRTRFTKRLSPMTVMGRANEDGLSKIASQVLEAPFHTEPVVPCKFAIRTSSRNHNTMKRDDVIQQIATAVGPKHSVDLKNYDRLIIVEIYQNICGMSVVSDRFEALKRFNLAEIYNPTPKEDTPKEETLTEAKIVPAAEA